MRKLRAGKALGQHSSCLSSSALILPTPQSLLTPSTEQEPTCVPRNRSLTCLSVHLFCNRHPHCTRPWVKRSEYKLGLEGLDTQEDLIKVVSGSAGNSFQFKSQPLFSGDPEQGSSLPSHTCPSPGGQGDLPLCKVAHSSGSRLPGCGMWNRAAVAHLVTWNSTALSPACSHSTSSPLHCLWAGVPRDLGSQTLPLSLGSGSMPTAGLSVPRRVGSSPRKHECVQPRHS